MTQQTLFQREIMIDAPLDHVWQLVATEEGLRQWWGNPIFLESKEGGRCEEWRTNTQGTTRWQGAVTFFAPPHQINMTLRPEPARDDVPTLTTISISLAARGTETAVYVSQRAVGHPEAIDREQEAVPQQPHARNVPLAQLNRPVPGALPLPASSLSRGQIDPAAMLLSRAASDALRTAWEARLGALLTSVQSKDE